MVCPYCEQGRIVMAKIKKTGKKINICEECDTVWEYEINLMTGKDFAVFMKNEGCKSDWEELEI